MIQSLTRQKYTLFSLFLPILVRNMNLLQRPCSNCLCHLILKSCLSYKILNNETHGLMRAIHHHMPFMDNATNVSNKFTTTTAVKAINFLQKVEVFKLLTIIQQLNQVINYSQQSQRVNNHTPRPPPPGKRGMPARNERCTKTSIVNFVEDLDILQKFVGANQTIQ